MPFFSNIANLFGVSNPKQASFETHSHSRNMSRGRAANSNQDMFSSSARNRPYASDLSSQVALGVGDSSHGSRPSSPALPSNTFLSGMQRPDSPGPSRLQTSFSYPPRAISADGGAAYDHVVNPAIDAYDPSRASISGSFVNDPRAPRSGPWQPSAPHPHAVYPPLGQTWQRIRLFLDTTYPDLADSLNLPATALGLNELELRLNMPLPSSVRESYLCTDGQDTDGGCTDGLFFGLPLMPLEEVLLEWQYWRRVEMDPQTGANTLLQERMRSFPPRWCKRAYANRGWLPLISDRAGNYVGVDLDPGPAGEWGQVILFGRDFDTKCVLWKGEGEGGWGRWLASFADDLESAEGWELERDGNESSDSEDEIGYTSYSGGNVYGNEGHGLRLSGHYRGWPVLEALFDKSAREWDRVGLLVDKAQNRDEFGLEAKPSVKEASPAEPSDSSSTQTQSQPESEPQPSLLVPESKGPSTSSSSSLSNGGPRLLVSPASSSSPLNSKPTGEPKNPTLLSPIVTKSSSSSSSPLSSSTKFRHSHNHTASLPPKPVDLPTRSDVIAVEAVAVAVDKNLRGGWIMGGLNAGSGLEDGSHAAGESLTQSESSNPSSALTGQSTMVDVDLEEGLGSRFGKRSADGGVGGVDGDQPSPRPSLSSFFSRRSSDGRVGTILPQELPLPMSLPPTPPQSLSPPPSQANVPLIEPPARMKSPLGISNVLQSAKFDQPISSDQSNENESGDGMIDVNLQTTA